MLTYKEFCNEYPPSKELELDCLYESIKLKLAGHLHYISTSELIERSMKKEYNAYCQLMKQKGFR